MGTGPPWRPSYNRGVRRRRARAIGRPRFANPRRRRSPMRARRRSLPVVLLALAACAAPRRLISTRLGGDARRRSSTISEPTRRRSRRPRRRPRRTSIRDSASCTASATRRRSAPSARRRVSIRTVRCALGHRADVRLELQQPDRRRPRARGLGGRPRARALGPRATPRERAIIEAQAARHSSDATADRAALDRAYADAMREVARQFPDDPDAATSSPTP